MFTQDELKQAVKQMKTAQVEDRRFGELAAEKINKFLRPNRNALSADDVNPYGRNFELYDIAKQALVISLTQYDNFKNMLMLLEKHGIQYKEVIKDWKENYRKIPIGNLDLTNDPQFASARQKIFNVIIKYYDAHWSGY